MRQRRRLVLQHHGRQRWDGRRWQLHLTLLLLLLLQTLMFTVQSLFLRLQLLTSCIHMTTRVNLCAVSVFALLLKTRRIHTETK